MVENTSCKFISHLFITCRLLDILISDVITEIYSLTRGFPSCGLYVLSKDDLDDFMKSAVFFPNLLLLFGCYLLLLLLLLLSSSSSSSSSSSIIITIIIIVVVVVVAAVAVITFNIIFTSMRCIIIL